MTDRGVSCGADALRRRLLAMALALPAAARAQPARDADAALARPAHSCAPLPPLPAPPSARARVKRVTDFGAGRGGDDSAAIERALAALAPGDWLLFPPGRYLHSRRLLIATPEVTLDGRGATLHADNPADMALLIAASGVRVLGFTLTARTDRRRAAPWESRIAVWRPAAERRGGPLVGVQIRANRIEPAPGGSDSSSSAAIFVSGVRDFLVAENTVLRSLSDGIHVTGGAHDGRVIGNTVRETGDDMIAVVSYLGDGMWTRGQTQELADTLAARRADKLVRNVLVADNDVEGQYWGRGISVVGGERVTIRANRIVNTAHAAGIYIAREQVYVSFGVRDVRVEDNLIARVQTHDAPYNPLPLPRRLHRTGHGAIELTARIFADEQAIPVLREALTVERVALVGNRIRDVRGAGIRIAEGSGEARTRRETDDKGRTVERESRGGVVREVLVERNRLAAIRGRALEVFGTGAALQLACRGNELDGRPLDGELCGGSAAAAQGAGLDCARRG